MEAWSISSGVKRFELDLSAFMENYSGLNSCTRCDCPNFLQPFEHLQVFNGFDRTDLGLGTHSGEFATAANTGAGRKAQSYSVTTLIRKVVVAADLVFPGCLNKIPGHLKSWDTCFVLRRFLVGVTFPGFDILLKFQLQLIGLIKMNERDLNWM